VSVSKLYITGAFEYSYERLTWPTRQVMLDVDVEALEQTLTLSRQ